VDGVNPFRCVQATWNLLEPSAGQALGDAHRAGWGVIVKESLANGRLARPDPAGPLAAFQRLADDRGVASDTLALAAVLAQPWVDVVLSGAVTTEQLASNVRSLDVQLDESHTAVLGELAEPADQYWTRRSRLPWA